MLIRVSGESPGVPYKMNGNSYSDDELKRELSKYVREFPYHFSNTDSESIGLVIYPDESASFAVVMRLLQLLKECGVTSYRVVHNFRENPKCAVYLSLPVQSDHLEVRREEVQPEPPKDPVLTPQQRIQEIAEKMGGLPRK